MKIRIEVEDEEGQAMTEMVFEGDRCRELAAQMIEALPSSEPGSQRGGKTAHSKTGSSRGLSTSPEPPDLDEDLTLKERMKLFLKYEMAGEWFSSKEAKRAYDGHYGEEIPQSTVSTYLSRMYRNDFLERRGSRAEREYQVVEAPEGEAEAAGEAEFRGGI